jgi:8-oxo-dGTP pyrophosphatase MutT (NUDIX family)
MENIEDALHREALEELGIDDLVIHYPIRLWHFFRGEKSPETEIIGVTFLCSTNHTEPQLSHEHTDYAWVTAKTALERVTVSGIRQDIEIFSRKKQNMHLSEADSPLKTYDVN